MKKLLFAFLAGLLLVGGAQAQQTYPRVYSQAELDALLAPIALHPDGLLSQILMAATYPDEVAAAASWSRAHPYLKGEDAVRAVQYEPWDPSVKALVAFPDLLARMDGSPQWLHDLGEAFLLQEPQVMETVQGLRRRAAAGGYLTNNGQRAVYYEGDAIVVQPRTEIVYVSYYDPYVVYGPWWWPYYRPMYWRPWTPSPVFVSFGFFYSTFDWPHRYVRVVQRPVYVQPRQTYVVPGKWQHRKFAMAPVAKPQVRVPEVQRQPIQRDAPVASPITREPQRQQRVPELRRQPIAHGAPLAIREAPRQTVTREAPRQVIVKEAPHQVMPAAGGFSHQRQEFRGYQKGHVQPRGRDQREHWR